MSVTVFAQSNRDVVRLSEPIQEKAEFEVFGADMDLNKFQSPSNLS